MLFNSFEFFVFLPIVFVLYWFVCDRWLAGARFQVRVQNALVVVASYVFYGWWDWRFLLLISFTSICSYLSGVYIQRMLPDDKRKAKAVCVANAVVNLAVLGVFKYLGFFVDNFVRAFTALGVEIHASSLDIILPVGISFYTFQALGYSIDVYKGKIEATTDVVSFFAFISFFPQLVAGPIERATSLLPQFKQRRVFRYEYAVEGCRQMLWGFFKKVVIADNCAYYADMAFHNYREFGSLSLLLGAVFFSFQIYCDFSGYSSIAIGCAKLFGIELCANFRVPYFSRDIAEFWRRWHISLNKWFVDYVYIPLGGSRVRKSLIVRNILIVFTLSGLWHGANWTYVCWGLYHACLFLPLILIGNNHKHTGGIHSEGLLPSFSDAMKMLATFALATIGWIIFRAENIVHAGLYICGMFSFRTNPELGVSVVDSFWLLCVIVLMLCVEWLNRNSAFEFEKLPRNSIVRNLIYIVLIASSYMAYMFAIEDDSTFIYFQF